MPRTLLCASCRVSSGARARARCATSPSATSSSRSWTPPSRPSPSRAAAGRRAFALDICRVFRVTPYNIAPAWWQSQWHISIHHNASLMLLAMLCLKLGPFAA